VSADQSGESVPAGQSGESALTSQSGESALTSQFGESVSASQFGESVRADRSALAAEFAEELAACTFPPAGSAVTCAVSGGADSTALLVLAVAAGCAVEAVHVDHGLRLGSAAEADFVADLAARFGASFRAESAVVADGSNVEARARAARYGVLPADVMTGHTADDQAETILLNLLRGAGLEGMAGMRAGHRRPLLALRRHHTESLCRRLGIVAFDDPTNDSPRFRRNRVRHELLPLFNEIADRDIVPVLCRQADLFAEAADTLDALSLDLDATDALALQDAALPVASQAIRRLLADGPNADHPPDRATVDRVLAVVNGTARATDVGQGWRVRRSQQRLYLDPPAERGRDCGIKR